METTQTENTGTTSVVVNRKCGRPRQKTVKTLAYIVNPDGTATLRRRGKPAKNAQVIYKTCTWTTNGWSDPV